MTPLVKCGAVAATVALLLVRFGEPAGAAVSITVPTSVSLGSAPAGSTVATGQLGLITVDATGLVAPSFTTTVATSVFTTGSAGPNETIAKSAVAYWSGPAVVSTGALSVTPGQLTAADAQVLSSPRTAFSAQGRLLTIKIAWNPTLTITLPSSAVAGTYTGTITHSVA